MKFLVNEQHVLGSLPHGSTQGLWGRLSLRFFWISDAGYPLRLQEELSIPQVEVLEFGVPLLREAAWELWPRAQQIALHLECACFLQDLACRCGSCHGGDFVPFHRFAVGSTKSSRGTSRFCSYKSTGSVLTQVITDKLQLPCPQGKPRGQKEDMWIAPLFIHKLGALHPKGEIAVREKNRWKELFILQVSEIRKV